jgi:DNA-binding response OmpR family regulator
MNIAEKDSRNRSIADKSERAPAYVTTKRRRKILIVDDEPDLVHALLLRLRSVGYEVFVASDGASATQAAVREQPDLVVLDVGLPCGNGYVVARRLAENAKTMHMPVIFLTARAGEVDRALALETGAIDFITKPFDPARLLTAISSALEPCDRSETQCDF